jgi:hypothetical protein
MQRPTNLGAAPQFSSDAQWWWDGRQWMSAVSPDGRYHWNGTAWSPVRKMFLGDYANQAIFCAIAGLLCGFLFPFGLWAGYRAYKELPLKQTQAIVGMVLNTVGCGLVVLAIMYRIYLASQ